MKLEKWAHIAAIVGSFAVVVTLIVLIVEVRANTELARVTAYDSVSRDFDESRRDWLFNPESFQLFYQFNEGTLPDWGSNPEDGLKAILMLMNAFTSLERAYLAYQAEIINEDEWPRIHRSACIQWALLRDTEYYSPVAFRLTDRYVAYLNATCTPEFVEEIQEMYRGDATE